MKSTSALLRALVCGLPLTWGTTTVCFAQEASPAPTNTIPPSTSKANTLLAATSTRGELEEKLQRQAEEALAAHPLEPILKIASDGLERLDTEIKDYSCILVKRERIDGRLQPTQYILAKIRHKPFSVYLKFLGPKKLKGRECLYVEGKNNGKLIAHEGQGFLSKLPSIKLDPQGDLAMDSQRYAITEIGIRRLAQRIYATIQKDRQHDECMVKLIPNVKIKDRETYCVQITHPLPREHFSFHVSRVFVDKKLGIPIRYAGYLWPKTPGDDPILNEEYTYLQLKINNNFTDEDFDPGNEKYNF